MILVVLKISKKYRSTFRTQSNIDDKAFVECVLNMHLIYSWNIQTFDKNIDTVNEEFYIVIKNVSP